LAVLAIGLAIAPFDPPALFDLVPVALIPAAVSVTGMARLRGPRTG
jgi:hypothetical protein